MNNNNNNNNNRNNESDFVRWWKEQPVVTRTITAGMLIETLLHSFHVIDYSLLLFSRHHIFKRFELWRLFTSLIFNSLGFPFLINMFTFYQHSSQLEQAEFFGRSADYAWILVTCLPFLWLGALVMKMPVLTSSFLMVVIYYWSKKFVDQNVSFMFGLRFRGVYLPWAFLAFHVLLGGSTLPDLLGIAVGHVAWFVTCVLPNTHKIQVVKTPGFMKRLIPNSSGPAGIRYGNGEFVPRNNNNNNNGGGGNDAWRMWGRERDMMDQQQQQQQQQDFRRRGGGHVLGDE